MPKMSKSGKPKQRELPSTLRNSPAKAQRTFAKAYDSAMDQYEDEERAHRTAYAALKHSYERVGDRWEAKEARGPSDSGAQGSDGPTEGGVNANATKEHLYDVARRLDIPGRSTMNKEELVDSIQKANDKAARESR